MTKIVSIESAVYCLSVGKWNRNAKVWIPNNKLFLTTATLQACSEKPIQNIAINRVSILFVCLKGKRRFYLKIGYFVCSTMANFYVNNENKIKTQPKINVQKGNGKPARIFWRTQTYCKCISDSLRIVGLAKCDFYVCHNRCKGSMRMEINQ